MTKRQRTKRSARAGEPRPKKQPIADSVARSLEHSFRQTVIDLSAVREGRRIGAAIERRAPDASFYDGLHPAHGVYVFTLNQLQTISEIAMQLEELDRLSNAINRALDKYEPSAPPLSPLTLSYFNGWAFFDCGVGLERETLGSVFLHLRGRLALSPEFCMLLEKWQASRMGLYEVQGFTSTGVRLRELMSNETIEAFNTSRYKGEVGKVWYVRVLPPPTAAFGQHVILTTPYEVIAPAASGWLAYLERALPKTKIAEPRRAYEFVMKWGLERDHWHEYIFEAYAGHGPDHIKLMGLPDVPASLPHSELNDRDDGASLDAYIKSGAMAEGALA